MLRNLYLCSQSSSSSFKPGTMVRSIRADRNSPLTSVLKADSQRAGYSMHGYVKACNDVCIDCDSRTFFIIMAIGMISPARSHLT
jgi:hypothetical protein